MDFLEMALCDGALSLIAAVAPDSKRECIERFGKQPNSRIVRDNDQICTTEYSRIVPLENGEVRPLPSANAAKVIEMFLNKCDRDC